MYRPSKRSGSLYCKRAVHHRPDRSDMGSTEIEVARIKPSIPTGVVVMGKVEAGREKQSCGSGGTVDERIVLCSTLPLRWLPQWAPTSDARWKYCAAFPRLAPCDCYISIKKAEYGCRWISCLRLPFSLQGIHSCKFLKNRQSTQVIANARGLHITYTTFIVRGLLTFS